jgi:hypothetical protein
MTIVIKPSGMMYGNFEGKEIFSIMMKNNVWTINTNRLFEKLNSLPIQKEKAKKLKINYANETFNSYCKLTEYKLFFTKNNNLYNR